jgi:hypothetical protein
MNVFIFCYYFVTIQDQFSLLNHFWLKISRFTTSSPPHVKNNYVYIVLG